MMKKHLKLLWAIIPSLIIIFFSPILMFRIVTPSMTPIIHVNDVVIIQTWINKNSIQVGDIIAFKANIVSMDQKSIVIHYVHSIEEINGARTYQTIAEIADEPDQWTIHNEDIVGSYVTHIEGMGRVILFLDSWIGKLILFMNVALIVFWLSVDSTPKGKKQPHAS